MAQVSAGTVLAGQLELFAGLAVPASPERKRWTRKAARPASPLFVQLAFELHPPPARESFEEEDDEDLGPATFEHRWVDAAGREPPKTRAPCSIFELGARQAAAKIVSEFTLSPARWAEPEPDTPPVRHCRIVREGDVTRYIPMREQETEQWAEKERARRARQVLPKPPRQTFRLKKKETA